MLSPFQYEIKASVRRLWWAPASVFSQAALIALAAGTLTSALAIVYPRLAFALPFPAQSRIVALWETRGGDLSQASRQDVLDLQVASGSLSDLGFYQAWNPVLTGVGRASIVEGASVSPGFLRTLGFAPQLAARFAESSDPDQVILSRAFWLNHFTGATRAGFQITLDGRPYRVAAIAPPDWAYPVWPEPAEVWRPLRLSAGMKADRMARGLGVVALLRPGESPAGASAKLRSAAQRLEQMYPASNRGVGVRLVSLRRAMLGDQVEAELDVLLLLSTLIALTAWVDASGVAMGGAMFQRADLALRWALGANPVQTLGPVAADATIVATMAAVLAAMTTFGWEQVATTVHFAGISHLGSLPRASSFAMAAVLAIALCWASYVPAALSLLGNWVAALPARVPHSWLRVLLGAQIAFTVTAVAGSILMLTTVRAIKRQPVGFQPHGVLAVELNLRSQADAAASARLRYLNNALASVRRIRGVNEVAAVGPLPWGATLGVSWFGSQASGSADFVACSPTYFSALGIALKSGRVFRSIEPPRGAKVIVVNAAFAKALQGPKGPLGSTIQVEDFGAATIVGIVANFRSASFTEAVAPAIFAPLSQVRQPFASLLVRTRTPGPALQSEIIAAVSAIDPSVPVRVETMDRIMDLSIAQQTSASYLLTILAIVGVLLTLIGAYGAGAMAAAARKREMAIRIALGAPPLRALAQFVRPLAVVILVGAAAGLPLAALCRRWLSPLIWAAAAPATSFVMATACIAVFGMTLVAIVPPAALVIGRDYVLEVLQKGKDGPRWIHHT